MGQGLHVPGPQFPHLQNGNDFTFPVSCLHGILASEDGDCDCSMVLMMSCCIGQGKLYRGWFGCQMLGGSGEEGERPLAFK